MTDTMSTYVDNGDFNVWTLQRYDAARGSADVPRANTAYFQHRHIFRCGCTPVKLKTKLLVFESIRKNKLLTNNNLHGARLANCIVLNGILYGNSCNVYVYIYRRDHERLLEAISPRINYKSPRPGHWLNSMTIII